MMEILIFVAGIFDAIRQNPNLQALAAFAAMFYVLLVDVGTHYYLRTYHIELYVKDWGFPISLTLIFLPIVAILYLYQRVDGLGLLFH